MRGTYLCDGSFFLSLHNRFASAPTLTVFALFGATSNVVYAYTGHWMYALRCDHCFLIYEAHYHHEGCTLLHSCSVG